MVQQAGGGAGFGLSAHEIYEQVTGGPGTWSLDAAYEATRLEVELEGQRAQEIVRLAEAIKQGWQGEAADAAVGAAAPMADTAWERTEYLRTAQTALEEQGVNFRHTLNSVVPVPPSPPESNIINDVVPWETDLDADIKRYQNDAQNNIVVYGGYDKGSLDNEVRMPRDYPSTTDWSGDISVKGAPEGGRPPSGGEFQPRGSSSWAPDGGPGSGEGEPLSVGDPRQAPAQGTEPADTAPPGVRPPVVVPPPGNPPPGSQPPVGGWPPGIVPPPGGRRPGFGPESGRGSGSGGPFGRGGGAEGGPGGRSAGGPGARGGVAGEPEGRPGARGGVAGEPEGRPGARGGVAGEPEGRPGARGGATGEPGVRGGVPGEPGGRPGSGAVAAEEGARRGAGGRGVGVAGGFGPVGVGRPAGHEDEEHQRKYTVEPDPEEMFGSDERTAPPVIGVEEEVIGVEE